MYIGICGPGTFETTRLMSLDREASRAAMAWIVGGAHDPMLIRNSAPTASFDSLRCAVAVRMSFSRRFPDMVPMGRSTKIDDTRFPRAASSPARIDTGTMVRWIRPRVGSPRDRNSVCRPPATAARTTSFTVPPRPFFTSLKACTGASTMANRRLGPTGRFNGLGGANTPPPTSSRQPVQDRGHLARHDRRGLDRPLDERPEGGERVAQPVLDRVAQERRRSGWGSGRHSGEERIWGSGEKSNSTEARSTAATPSTIAWCTLVRMATRPSSMPSIRYSSQSGLVRSSGREITRCT